MFRSGKSKDFLNVIKKQLRFTGFKVLFSGSGNKGVFFYSKAENFVILSMS